MHSYWDRVLNRRLTRRRALAATGAAAGAAAFLAACGGDKEEGGGGQASELLINGKEVDTTDKAKRGGVWKAALSRDPQNFDLYNFDPFSQGFANVVGSKLVWIKPSRMKDPTSLEVVPDIATWEISPDKLTYTFKIMPNALFGPLSPTFHQGAPQSIANRPFDSEDVAFSWERFKTVSSNAGELHGERGGPVESLTTPDKQTVVMKLKQPFSPFLGTLANASVSYFYILPKEGRGQDANFFNRWQFGGGPFYIDRFEPSVRLVLKRNPNYEKRDTGDGGLKRPFVDEVNFVILPDPTAAEAQFRAGQIFTPGLGLSTVEGILQAKKDIPELQLRGTPDATAVTEWFGMSAEGPWKDERVRQAVHYAWDNDTFIDVTASVDKLEAAGIPVEKRYNTAIPGGGPGSYMYFPGMWLDPKGKDFGENAKYYQFNPAEAKKLLSAAGFPNGFEFKHIQYPLGFGQQPQQDVMDGMYANIGLKATQEKVTIPDIFNYIFPPQDKTKPAGNWKEMLNTVDYGGPDVGNYLLAHFSKRGNLFGGWDPNGKGATTEGDPFLNETTDKVLLEFDNNKRIELVREFQRYMAKKFYYHRYPGGVMTLALTWPVISNFGVWRGQNLNAFYTFEWIDDTKRPLSG
ncbi:MAG TPA: ABC transporter substrate-binding protein [Dehalococcoidia bacterium]|nr:ABC transporter substrate-binding protein [Dehalococcoidia bacterium]